MKIKKIVIELCEACLVGEGEECHTPGCALWMHNSPGHPINEELYTVLDEYELREHFPELAKKFAGVR